MRRLLPCLLILLSSCVWEGGDLRSVNLGFAPVYAPRTTANTITTEPARPTAQPGKIYAYGTYAFQVDQYKGIHIIDNSNPKEARKIAFLSVPMATEIAIKSGHLYTNNLNDLVVFSLANVTQPQLVNRIKDAFPVISQEFPPFSNTYFECPDTAKGVVVGWEQKELSNPKCRR
jgi:hypothetical protein